MIEFLTSFSLLNSIWLIGLLSLVVPVIIHLFNRSRGKVVLIGRIEFVKQVQNLKVTEVKLTQWLLLIVRLILLLLLILLLTGLVRKSEPQIIDHNQIYLSKSWLNCATDNELEQLVDEHKNDEIIYLGSQLFTISNSNNHSISRLTKFREEQNRIEGHQPKVSLSALLFELESKNEKAKQRIIYTTNELEQFGVKKPKYTELFEWRVKSLVPPVISNATVKINLYYEASRSLDVNYLKLAFETLNQIRVDSYDVRYIPMFEVTGLEQQKLRQSADWSFWFADREVDELIYEQVDSGSNLLTDVVGNKSAVHLVSFDGDLVKFYIGESISLLKENFDLIWSSISGEVLLSKQLHGKGMVFRLNSRFNHQWTGLVEMDAFPEQLNKLLTSPLGDLNSQLVSASEVETEKDTLANVEVKSESLNRLLVLCICFFWLLERFIAEQAKSTPRARQYG